MSADPYFNGVYPTESSTQRIGVVKVEGVMVAVDAQRYGEKTVIEPQLPFGEAIDPAIRGKVIAGTDALIGKIVTAFKAGNKGNTIDRISNTRGVDISPVDGQRPDALFDAATDAARGVLRNEVAKTTADVTDKQAAAAKAAIRESAVILDTDTRLYVKPGDTSEALLAGAERVLQEQGIHARLTDFGGFIKLEVPHGHDRKAFEALKSQAQGTQSEPPELAGMGASLPAAERRK
ncbi:MAG: hypothetical protein K2Q01_11610 [Rickettsiales bacterium]|nr:hypothetical protein [Rickettsiales bacterium]